MFQSCIHIEPNLVSRPMNLPSASVAATVQLHHLECSANTPPTAVGALWYCEHRKPKKETSKPHPMIALSERQPTIMSPKPDDKEQATPT
jgi:hypothetical protein